MTVLACNVRLLFIQQSKCSYSKFSTSKKLRSVMHQTLGLRSYISCCALFWAQTNPTDIFPSVIVDNIKRKHAHRFRKSTSTAALHGYILSTRRTPEKGIRRLVSICFTKQTPICLQIPLCRQCTCTKVLQPSVGPKDAGRFCGHPCSQ